MLKWFLLLTLSSKASDKEIKYNWNSTLVEMVLAFIVALIVASIVNA